MASRRASAVSTRSAKQRKYSTDRHQRQAELSIRIEEGRSLRPPLVREEEVSTSFVKDFFSKPQSANVASSLSHADVGPSPLDIHPGHRVRGFSDAYTEDWVDDKQHFPEPNAEQQLELEQRGAIFGRFNTDINAEEAHLRITRSASDARKVKGPIDRLKRLLGGKSVIKPGAYSGLQHAAGLATAHANAVLSQKPAPLFKRRALYVLEYSMDNKGVLFCAPPKFCDGVSNLKQHLEGNPQSDSVLRLIYSCNNEEAVNYLSHAFGISGSGSETGERSFRDWMQDERDTRRASQKAIRWRPAFDIARGVICSAFGLDFGSLVVPFEATIPSDPQYHTQSELHHGPNDSQDQLSLSAGLLYRQRISVYMQRASSEALPGPRVTCFNSGLRQLHEMARKDTIIICEYSSGSAGEIVSVPALLGLNPELATASGPLENEATSSRPEEKASASTSTVRDVVSHVFDGLYQIWHSQIALIHEPHAELEDHIYAHPADSSRAREVWAMSQRLHTLLKLVNRHSKVIQDVQDDFLIFAETRDKDNGRHQNWLAPLLDDFELLAENFRTDYLEPLEHMIDLMYKSVTIRDSKQSLELNASLWRLSWITFIFLPLTFLVGAFGMNVDSFRDGPSIKWYFVAAVPLMLVVFFLWFAMRRFAPGQKVAIVANRYNHFGVFATS